MVHQAQETSPTPWDACHTNRDLSQEREVREAARYATLAKQVVEAIAGEMIKAHVHYQAIINEMSTATMPTSFKVTFGTSGLNLMDPFNWSKDRAIYQ